MSNETGCSVVKILLCFFLFVGVNANSQNADKSSNAFSKLEDKISNYVNWNLYRKNIRKKIPGIKSRSIDYEIEFTDSESLYTGVEQSGLSAILTFIFSKNKLVEIVSIISNDNGKCQPTLKYMEEALEKKYLAPYDRKDLKHIWKSSTTPMIHLRCVNMGTVKAVVLTYTSPELYFYKTAGQKLSPEPKYDVITSKRRVKALRLLGESRKIMFQVDGITPDLINYQKAVSKCEDAIKADPKLAIAYIIRAQFAFMKKEWQKAKKEFEHGLKLIDQVGQPMNPPGQLQGAEASKNEVKGDALCQLSMVYVRLASHAKREKNPILERKMLILARESAEKGLRLKPTLQMKEMAEAILNAFN